MEKFILIFSIVNIYLNVVQRHYSSYLQLYTTLNCIILFNKAWYVVKEELERQIIIELV
jgi:uncharacterized membrane protein YoaT (DUF817 family)